MIGYIEGQIKFVNENKIIVLTGGVGYDVMVPDRTARVLSIGEEIELMVHTEVREDAIDFYGFYTMDEKIFFQIIRGVHGIGPKTAMGLMGFDLSALKGAIETEDIKLLCSIKGLGKKGAERLILELKNKLPESVHESRQHRNVKTEVYDALENLGYRKKDIENILLDLPQGLEETQEIIKYFLQNL
jgi:Holliday junction DNA helicase RuvA